MLRVGLFGVEDIGRQHLKNWEKIEDIEVVGVYIPDGPSDLNTEIDASIPQYAYPVDLIEACDIVDITLPPQYHFMLCKEAISRSKHVLVEKLMADTMEEASVILKLVKEANIKFKVSQPERFNPAYIAAKRHITQPRYIEVRQQTKPDLYASIDKIVLDLMIYDIDIVLSLMESNVKSVAANAVSMGGLMPDVVNARIQFDNGSVANITASRVGMEPKRQMVVFQNESYIDIDLLNAAVKLFKLAPVEASTDQPADKIFIQDIESMDIALPISPYNNPIEAEMRSFITSIKYNTPILVDELAGYRAIEIAYKIIAQIKKHKFI